MQAISVLAYGGTCEGPVTIYLHGKGGFGDATGLYEYEDFPKLLRDGDYHPASPFLILHAKNGEYWALPELHEALSAVSKQNPNRELHLIGYSRGGTAIHRYLTAYPTTPVSKATIINARLCESYLSKIPLKLFHAKEDHTQPIDDIFRFVEQNGNCSPVELVVTEGDHFNIGAVARQILEMMPLSF